MISAPIIVRRPLPRVILDADLPVLGRQFCQLMADKTGRYVSVKQATDFVKICALRGWLEARVKYDPSTEVTQ